MLVQRCVRQLHADTLTTRYTTIILSLIRDEYGKSGQSSGERSNDVTALQWL